MSTGADDYLFKPFNPQDLQVRLIAAARVTALHRQLGDNRRELESLTNGLSAISLLDPLTNLGNRRSFQDDLDMVEAQVVRYGHRSCMALLDVDSFKGFNDTYGRLAGDEALVAVALELKKQARSGDAFYRYGGDECMCLFPEQSLETGAIAVERIRAGIQDLAIPHPGSGHGVMTVSAGLALLDSAHVGPASDVMKEADTALHRAKDLGRNRTEYGAVKVASPVT